VLRAAACVLSCAESRCVLCLSSELRAAVLSCAEVRKRDTGVMYAGECRQKGHFFVNFLTH
jgi:hypothetical protein